MYGQQAAADYPIGRLTSSSLGTLSSHYRYHSLGRVQASQQNVDSDPAYIFHYDQIPAGLLTMKYPSGRLVTNTYDNAGQPSGVTGYVSGIQYAPHGAMQGLTFGNNVQEGWLYNARLQPTCLSAGLAAAQPLLRGEHWVHADVGERSVCQRRHRVQAGQGMWI